MERIHVTVLCPGPVETNIFDNSMTGTGAVSGILWISFWILEFSGFLKDWFRFDIYILLILTLISYSEWLRSGKITPFFWDKLLHKNVIIQKTKITFMQRFKDTMLTKRPANIMTAARCAELCLTSIANKLEESWMAPLPNLPFMYLAAYQPFLYSK